ncbi:hypothetical protein [Thermococcus sp.]|nr:hypothetical protein [Thermococcus sp.]
MDYRWLNFIVLFVGILATNHLAMTEKNLPAALDVYLERVS